MELYRRQFIVNQNPWHDRWQTVPLAENFYLHAHPDLRLSRLHDVQGQEWYLLGTAVPACRDMPVAEEVARTATREVWQVSDGWAGRWVLIGGGEVGLDAAGMLGLFYNPQTREASSSPCLITTGNVTHRIRSWDRMNWYAPPSSRFEGVLRLLPSQRLHLAGFRPVPRPLLAPLPGRSYQETLDELEAVLKRTVRNMAHLGRVIMPLTGGHDSRLILSVLVALGNRPDTYTLEHNSNMSTADRVLPPRIAAALGLKHTYVVRPFRVRYPEVYELYGLQSGGHAIEQDRQYSAYGQLDHITDDHVVLHGGGFDIGRRHFCYKRFPAHGESERKYSYFEPLPPAARAALQRYEEWVTGHPEEMDWRDRLYWEQRLGGWISACGLATDMMPGLRLPPANCRYTLSLLVSLPSPVRERGTHHADLVARLTPQIATLPSNPREPLIGYLGALPRKVLRRIRRIVASRIPLSLPTS